MVNVGINTRDTFISVDRLLGGQSKFNHLENMPLKPEQRQAAYDKWSPVLGEIFDDLDKDKSGFASVDEMWYVYGN